VSIPRIAHLATELHSMSEDGQVVITLQHWSDPTAPAECPRSWLRVLRNGQVFTDRRRGGGDRRFFGPKRALALNAELARTRARFAPTQLSPDDARTQLRKVAGVEPEQCQRGDRCGAPQILGWPYCPTCGADARKVASGSMSGVRRRVIATPVSFAALRS
jgi:hypothetical protein